MIAIIWMVAKTGKATMRVGDSTFAFFLKILMRVRAVPTKRRKRVERGEPVGVKLRLCIKRGRKLAL
jgi:hypothetical protein